MNEREYFLTCLGEECSEISKECCDIAQLVSKALRFGVDEVWKEQLGSNADRLIAEFVDLIGVAKRLKTMGVINFPFVDQLDDPRIDAKLAKLDKYLGYAKSMGTVLEEPAESEISDLAVRMASSDSVVAIAAQREFAEALCVPLRLNASTENLQ